MGINYDEDYNNKEDEEKEDLEKEYSRLKNTFEKILKSIVSKQGFSPESLLKLGAH